MAKTTIWPCMFKRPNSLLRSAAIAVWLVALTMHPALSDETDPSFTLKIEGAMVQLTANGVPLNRILTSLSSQSGIKLQSTEQATELIYCQLTNETVVETLKKLLRNWSFALIYKGESNGAASPDTLWIINRNPRSTTDPVHLVSKEDPDIPLQAHQKRFEKDALAKVFADPKKVLASFSAKDHFSVKDPIANVQSKCLQITSLSPNSPIREIGLQEEDLVVDVNGQPVTTAAELIQTITSAAQNGPPIIRIDRRRDGMIDPIYIETH